MHRIDLNFLPDFMTKQRKIPQRLGGIKAECFLQGLMTLPKLAASAVFRLPEGSDMKTSRFLQFHSDAFDNGFHLATVALTISVAILGGEAASAYFPDKPFDLRREEKVTPPPPANPPVIKPEVSF